VKFTDENTTRLPRAACALLGALAVWGCNQPASSDDGVTSEQSALLNQNEFVYLRCNATGFGVDNTTRLQPTSDPNVGTLTFNVTQTWMLTTGSGDQCIFTLTNQLNGWGSNPSSFTDSHPATALVPPADDSVVSGSPTFLVKYPALGTYTARVNWATKKFQIAPAQTVNVVGHVAASSIALSGLSVMLTGAVQSTSAVTDANGNFRFQPLQGAYSIAAATPPGSTLSPSGTVALGTVTADRIQDFACSGTCLATTAVAPERELMITSETVVADPVRTSNTSTPPGAWSFRNLVEQMLPAGADASAFIDAWLHQFDIPNGSVNGFPLDVRATGNLRALWPKKADGVTVDITKAPLRLLAIVNRVDVGAAGNGEGRFVFGVDDGSGNGQSMTVIFEFGLPSTTALPARRDWAVKFHSLGTTPLGPTYNANLQAVTDVFTKRGSSPAKPGGNSINQVRTNEILMGGPWQMREFHLSSVSNVLGLRIVTTALTPADSAVNTGTPENTALVNYINGQSALIHGGYGPIPASIIGGQSTEDFTWSFSQTVDGTARHSFAGMTCNGCHNSETNGLQIAGFYQISPFGPIVGNGSNTSRLSQFITQFELPRRSIFLMSLVGCSGSTCPTGGDPMFL
jgi:hypothetical protein